MIDQDITVDKVQKLKGYRTNSTLSPIASVLEVPKQHR